MMITEAKDYFAKGCGRCARFDTPDCSARRWTKGLDDLRAICRDAGLTETAKWGHPCYMHASRNIVIIGAFRDSFRLTFFNAALMTDPEGVLEKQGPNSQNASVIRFASNDAVKAVAAQIKAYLQEAMGYAEDGLKPAKIQHEADMPEELTDALDADPELAEAFGNLTPGRRKSYAINLNAAQKPATRIARIAKFRPHILAGKGALDR